MAITDIISSQQAKSTEFDCPHYAPLPGEKRCRHFLKNGSCDRPDELMCVEWLKRNSLEAGDRRPEGEKAPGFHLEVQEMPKPVSQPVKQQDMRPPIPELQPPACSLQPPLTGLTPEDIESFKSLNIEVCLKSDTFGEMWLVPKYTGQDRQELTPEHAATLCRLIQAFPGSKVTAFEKTSARNEENSK